MNKTTDIYWLIFVSQVTQDIARDCTLETPELEEEWEGNIQNWMETSGLGLPQS